MSLDWHIHKTPVTAVKSDPPVSFSTLVLSAGEEGVENEKCVVAQYRTTSEQKKIFNNHLLSCKQDSIAIEWVIDIADETNGWFYGTAYHYNDTNQMLHVMVPDKQNPTFDGYVQLDYRTVHMIECVDGVTDALFNKIVRVSTVKVKWEVDWFDEDTPCEVQHSPCEAADEVGRWTESCARYYLRIANQVLIEDRDSSLEEADSRGFVMLTADTNLKLKACVKGKGQDDFDRLVTDGSVLSTPGVLEAAKKSVANLSNPNQINKSSRLSDIQTNSSTNDGISVKKLADMSRGLKERLIDLLDEREKRSNDKSKMTKMFQKFAMCGDLDAGLALLADAEDQAVKDEKKKKFKSSSINEQTDSSDTLADEAWVLAQQLEKSTITLLRAGGDASTNAAEELDFLRKSQKRMKKELEEKDRELQSLYAARAR